MSNLFKLVISMSLSGTVLILILTMLRPFFKEVFSKAWQYYVWIIVLVRLLIPFSPEFGLINVLFEKEGIQYTASSEAPDVLDQGNTSLVSNQDNSPVYENSALPGMSVNETQKPASADNKFNFPNGWEVAGITWITGILLLLFIRVIQYLQFTYLVRVEAEPAAEKAMLNIMKRTAFELNIRKKPQLFISNYISSPMLIGVFKPSIYLTEATLNMDEKTLSYVLRHELMHYKRHDLWYKWFCELTLCIHWFNPFAYIMSRQINSQCETSCDEAVVRDFDTEGKLAYGKMLLNAAAVNTKYHRSVLSTTLCEDKKSMKERLITVLNAKRRTKRMVIISLAALIILCASAIYLGAYSGNNKAAADELNTPQTNDLNTTQTNDSGNADEQTQATVTSAPLQSDSTKRLTWMEVKNYAGGNLSYQNLIDTYYYEAVNSDPNNISFPVGADNQFSLLMKFDGTKNEPAAIQLYYQPANLTLDLNTENLATMMSLQNKLNGSGSSDQTANSSDTIKGGSGNTAENTDTSQESTETAQGSTETAQGSTDLSGNATNAIELPLNYENTEYGFNFALPESWDGYTVTTQQWQGMSTTEEHTGDVIETGPELSIIHPKSTADNPRQNIPIMIYTIDQWNELQDNKIMVSAAPINPSELGRNSKYVFALPARYNFAFLTGFEEVEQIIASNALTPTENFK